MDTTADTAIFKQTLMHEADLLRLGLSAPQLDALCAHYALLKKWNARIRIAGTTDPRRAAIELFADSLAACRFAEKVAQTNEREVTPENLNSGLAIMDIGSGAGLPGIPIKIARPDWKLTLVEINAKKVAFLKNALRELGVEADIAAERAEELAPRAELGYREAFDLVFCRAVAAPATACELAVPFLKLGGSFILQTTESEVGSGAKMAFEHITSAASQLGATIGDTTSYSLTGVRGQRVLVEVRKVTATPLRFPRASRIMKKNPLI
jgi:16S rRNA (guanine527-N7)-methyltransferase